MKKQPEIKKNELLLFEIRRKSIHLIFGTILILLIFLNILNLFHFAIFVAASVFVSFLLMNYKIPFATYLLEKLERPENLKKFPGKAVIFMFIGILLSLILFDRNIAIASIAIVIFGDAIAALFNVAYGKTKHPFSVSNRKLLEGTIAGTIAGFIAAVFFINWKLALAGSIFGMIFEALEIKINKEIIDDNIVVPIVAGTAMKIAQWLLAF